MKPLLLRQRAKYVRPISKNESTSLVVAIEPFFDLKVTDWGGESGPGQNRVSIGLDRRFSDRLSIEAGYMNQYVCRDNAENRVSHLGVLDFKEKL
jgi:hypothetical protein